MWCVGRADFWSAYDPAYASSTCCLIMGQRLCLNPDINRHHHMTNTNVLVDYESPPVNSCWKRERLVKTVSQFNQNIWSSKRGECWCKKGWQKPVVFVPLFVFVSVNFVPHLNSKAAGAFHLFKGMSLIQKVERRKKQNDFIVKKSKKVVTKSELELSFSCMGCVIWWDSNSLNSFKMFLY